MAKWADYVHLSSSSIIWYGQETVMPNGWEGRTLWHSPELELGHNLLSAAHPGSS